MHIKDGGFSIEPHMQVVYHEGEGISSEELKSDTYVEYGRRLMVLLGCVRTAGVTIP